MKHRISYIDNLKGFAILLVVLGHWLQYYICPETYGSNHLYHYIYAFHMPLFFVLSGYVSTLSVKSGTALKQIGKRALRLLVPFFVWAILDAILAEKFTLWEVLKNPDAGLWFLWVLFFVSLADMVGNYVAKKCKVPEIIASAVMLGVLFACDILLHHQFGTFLVAYYFFYFSLGKYLVKYLPNSMLLLPVGGILLAVFVGMGWYNVSGWPYRIALALIGCSAVIMLFKCCGAVLDRYFSWIGKRTLGIYAIQGFLVTTLPQDWNVFLLLPVFVVLLIALYFLLSTNFVTGALFLGNRKK